MPSVLPTNSSESYWRAGERTASQLESLAIESGPVLGNYYLKRIGWIEEVEPFKVPQAECSIMGIGWQQLLIVALIALLLFGSARLPTLMRDMGRSLNEFKRGMKDANNLDDDSDKP